MFYKKQFLNFNKINKTYNNTRKIATYNSPGGGNSDDIFIITLIVGFFIIFKNK
jgi:hypothetical protein